MQNQPGFQTEESALAAAKAGNPQAQFQVGMKAMQQGREDEFQHWIQQAASQDFPPALFRFGIWRLARATESPEMSAAIALVEKAANLGFLNAIRKMVIICTRGAGVLPDWQAGMVWFKKALQVKDPVSIREAGLLLLNAPDNEDVSKALLTHAAAAGDLLAAYHLGKLLTTSSVEAEWGYGLYWLNQALKGGHILAGKQLDQLKGNKTETPKGPLPSINWGDVEARLSNIKEPSENFEIQVVLENPRVRRIKNVLTSWECDYLIARAGPFLRPAMTIEAHAKGDSESDHRNNKVAKFWITQQDIVISFMERKIAHIGETPLDFAEDLSVLRYFPDEKNAPHYDSFLTDDPEQVAQIKRGGQRIRTCLVYLNEDFQGGETRFVKPDIKVRCEAGEALIFENLTLDGAPDLEALHEGLPTTSGVKWVISKWVRDKSQIVL